MSGEPGTWRLYSSADRVTGALAALAALAAIAGCGSAAERARQHAQQHAVTAKEVMLERRTDAHGGQQRDRVADPAMQAEQALASASSGAITAGI